MRILIAGFFIWASLNTHPSFAGEAFSKMKEDYEAGKRARLAAEQRHRTGDVARSNSYVVVHTRTSDWPQVLKGFDYEKLYKDAVSSEVLYGYWLSAMQQGIPPGKILENITPDTTYKPDIDRATAMKEAGTYTAEDAQNLLEALENAQNGTAEDGGFRYKWEWYSSFVEFARSEFTNITALAAATPPVELKRLYENHARDYTGKQNKTEMDLQITLRYYVAYMFPAIEVREAMFNNAVAMMEDGPKLIFERYLQYMKRMVAELKAE